MATTTTISSIKVGDIVVSKISGETARVIKIDLPHVTVRFKADSYKTFQRFYKDFELKVKR